MSYFYGTSVANFDSSNMEMRARRRHSRQRVAANNDDLEPVHGTRHRRRHASRARQVPKVKVIPADEQVDNCEDEAISSPKSKSRRHLRREIERLADENRTLVAKLEGSPAGAGTQSMSANFDDSGEKEILLSKVRNKYHKLEKNCQEVQAERDKLSVLLERREAEFRQLHLHHEELTQVLQNAEREKVDVVAFDRKLRAENSQLNEDVTLLKNLVYRMNVEMERYQDRLRRCDKAMEVKNAKDLIEDSDTTSESKRVSESWGRVNFHALAPLLNAYQENLAEKDELLEKYGLEMEHFSGRCKEIIEENEKLLNEIIELKSKCDRYAKEIETLTKDATAIKEQNDLLTKHTALQKQKIQEVHSVYEQKVDSMSQDNNKLHKEYLACKTELSNIRGKYEILSEGYEKLKGNSEKTVPISVHTTAVEECKRLFEELKHQYDAERKKLNARIKYLEETQPENEKQRITAIAERDQLKTLTKRLERDLKRAQHKLEHVQNTVFSVQISRDAFKRQLNKTTAYCEELVREQEKLLSERERLVALLKESERENENIHYLGGNIVHRMGNLKSQLRSVQRGTREQLATVEKRMRSQEMGVDRMKANYGRELQRLKQLVRQKEEAIGKLQREKCLTQGNLEMVWRAATSDDKKVKDALKNTKMYNI